MSEPQTDAGRALLLRLTTRGSGDNAPFEVAVARIEAEAAAAERARLAADIDEEALARALRWVDVLEGYPWEEQRPEGWRHRVLAHDIAAAYRAAASPRGYTEWVSKADHPDDPEVMGAAASPEGDKR